MKFSTNALTFLMATTTTMILPRTTDAFTVTGFHLNHSSATAASTSTRSHATSTDVLDPEEALAEAMKITDSLGIESPEARVAWEVVEELRSNDRNAAVTKPRLDEECALNHYYDDDSASTSTTTSTGSFSRIMSGEGGSTNNKCIDYERVVDELNAIRSEHSEMPSRRNIDNVGVMDALRAIKLQPHDSSSSTSSSSTAEVPAEHQALLNAAKVKAEVATDNFGIRSKEARLEWETYEEIAASIDHHRQHSRISSSNEGDDSNTPAVSSWEAALQAIKLTPPSPTPSTPVHSPQLALAWTEAKVASENFGSTSKEARLAWETYEEVASSLSHRQHLNQHKKKVKNKQHSGEADAAMTTLRQILPMLETRVPAQAFKSS